MPLGQSVPDSPLNCGKGRVAVPTAEVDPVLPLCSRGVTVVVWQRSQSEPDGRRMLPRRITRNPGCRPAEKPESTSKAHRSGAGYGHPPRAATADHAAVVGRLDR